MCIRDRDIVNEFSTNGHRIWNPADRMRLVKLAQAGLTDKDLGSLFGVSANAISLQLQASAKGIVMPKGRASEWYGE